MFFKIVRKQDLEKLVLVIEATDLKEAFLKLSEIDSFLKINNKDHYYEDEDSKIIISRVKKEEFKSHLKSHTLHICKNSLKMKGKKVFHKYEVAFYGEDGRAHRTVLNIIWAKNKKEAGKIYKGQYDHRFEPLEKVKD